MSLISKLYDFVENKGRFEKGREPVYGEPFYHDYVYQLIKSKYEIGDKVKSRKRRWNNRRYNDFFL